MKIRVCGQCKGTGVWWHPGSDPDGVPAGKYPCPACGGTGQEEEPPKKGRK